LGKNTKIFKKLASKEVLLANVTLISRENKEKMVGRESRGGPIPKGGLTLGGHVTGLGGSCLPKASHFLGTEVGPTFGGTSKGGAARLSDRGLPNLARNRAWLRSGPTPRSYGPFFNLFFPKICGKGLAFGGDASTSPHFVKLAPILGRVNSSIPHGA
jgi:hypothetical protein